MVDVRKIRERMGLSITDFAKQLHVTRQTVHAWEKKPPEPSPALLLLERMQKDLDENPRPGLREIPAGAPRWYNTETK
jgi:DNA-binding transcriptional regulator YiaG